MAEELDKPLLDPESFNHEGIDLVPIPLEEVFELLRTSRRGLSTEDAEARLLIFGPNKLEEKKENKILKFLSFMWNPLSWVMEAASIMEIVLANGGGEGPDWQDFVGIMCLIAINSTISFVEDNNAGNAAATLMARLAPKTKEKKRNNLKDFLNVGPMGVTHFLILSKTATAPYIELVLTVITYESV